MSHDLLSKKRQAARDAWLRGRHSEGRDRHARYYAMNDHPNSRAFGRADFVDAQGREYRVATSGHVPGHYVRLWLRVPRGVPWFRDRPGPRLRVALRQASEGRDKGRGGGDEAPALVVVTIHELYRSHPSHRTAHLYIAESEFPLAQWQQAHQKHGG